MSSTVETIKERLGIAEVVGSYITLEKSGSNFKAKCPFHNERTPSFYVSPDRGSFYCFGCGAKGDIFSFVEQFEGVDFKTALSMLADRAGVTIERFEREGEKDDKKRLFAILEDATVFFQHTLKDNKDALLYLKNRGLDIETLRAFRLGCASGEWRSLKSYLKGKGYTEKEMLDAGLIKENEKAEESYDRFRGRIMFPIFDTAGKVIGFSGRVLNKDEEPKYLNSPDTVLFNKSHVLYGYNFAKNTIREKGFAVLVEGQMDLLLSHEAGLTNTVASSGTALTEGHLALIKRLAHTVVIGYDADKAGRNATFRAWKLALSLGLDVKIALLPDGLDPADAVLKDKNIWIHAVENAKHVIDYFLETMKTEEERGARDLILTEKILPLVKSIESSINASRFIQKISFETGISENALHDELLKIKFEVADASSTPQNVVKPKQSEGITRAVGFMLWLESIKSPYAPQFKEDLIKFAGDISHLVPETSIEKDTLIFEMEMSYEGTDLQKTGQKILLRSEEDLLKKQLTEAMERLRKAESVNDNNTVETELLICQKISERLQQIQKLHQT